MQILLITLAIAGGWDGFTTFYGTQIILGHASIQLFASTAFAIIILGFLFGTKSIWGEIKPPFLALILRLMWLTSFGYDMYTSFIGNRDIILGNANTNSQMAILIGMTILVSGSPIIFSAISGIRNT